LWKQRLQRNSPTEVTNIRFEAMKGLFNGTKKLFVVADGAKQIMQAVAFGKQMGVSVVIVGGKNHTWLQMF
jgi:hypothetical protein